MRKIESSALLLHLLLTAALLHPGVALCGERAAIRFQFANGLLDRCEYEMAVEQYRAVIQDAPDLENLDAVYFGLGLALYRWDRPKEAVSAFRALVAKYPNSKLQPKGLYFLGHSYFKLSMFEKARDSWLQICNTFPDNTLAPEARFLVANACLRLGNTHCAYGWEWNGRRTWRFNSKG